MNVKYVSTWWCMCEKMFTPREDAVLALAHVYIITARRFILYRVHLLPRLRDQRNELFDLQDNQVLFLRQRLTHL